jgi:hypothetical protein
MKNKIGMQWTRLMGVTVWALSAAGCGTFQTHSKDASQVSQVKKVAVVAFSVREPAAAGIGLDLGSGKVGASAGGSAISEKDSHSDLMFSDLLTSLHQTMKWTVIDQATMTHNAGYKAAYQKTMTGWQNKMPPGKGEKQFLVEGVMDFDGPRILDSSGRDALIKALNVDAILVANVNVILEATTVMGIGSRHPQSRLSFMLYKAGIEKPIWFEGGVEGQPSTESVGKTAFIDETLLGALAVKSARTAYEKVNETLE